VLVKGRKLLPLAASAPLLLGAFAEIALRLVLGLGQPPLSVPHPTIEYMFKPSQDVKPFHNRVLINSFAMRSPDFPRIKASQQELRVLVLGDSVINGGNLTDQRDLATTIAASLLSDRWKRPVIVGNVSAGSWGPGNWLAYLKEFGHLDADALIVVASSHDMYDEPAFGPLDPSTHPTSAPILALWEAATRYAPRYLPTLRPQALPAQETAASGMRRSSAGSLRGIAEYARKAKVPLCLLHHLTRSELEHGVSTDGKELHAAAGELELPVSDDADALRASIAAGEGPLRDHIHINAAGQKVLAWALAAVVERCLPFRAP
jgi:lysophospholipase L1-like esterase